MSTRSQLRFVRRPDAEPDGGEQVPEAQTVQVYCHTDGYPSSIVLSLARLKELLDATKTERGPSYTAAVFLFLDKLDTMELYLDRDSKRSIQAETPADLLRPSNMEHLNQPLFLLGHGVEDPAAGIHGDEEFLYVVELPDYAPSEHSEWTIKVSAHCGFPRWGGHTAEAFERASWQFEGSLSAALKSFTSE